jgi:hypothetical protein
MTARTGTRRFRPILTNLVGAALVGASGCSVVKAFERETAVKRIGEHPGPQVAFEGELSEEWCALSVPQGGIVAGVAYATQMMIFTFPDGPPPRELLVPRDLR